VYQPGDYAEPAAAARIAVYQREDYEERRCHRISPEGRFR